MLFSASLAVHLHLLRVSRLTGPLMGPARLRLETQTLSIFFMAIRSIIVIQLCLLSICCLGDVG